jgi:hypothetical protein
VSSLERFAVSLTLKLRSSLGASVSRKPSCDGSMTARPLRVTLYITWPSLSKETFTFSTAPGEACDATTAAMAVDIDNGMNSASSATLNITFPPAVIIIAAS